MAGGTCAQRNVHRPASLRAARPAARNPAIERLEACRTGNVGALPGPIHRNGVASRCARCGIRWLGVCAALDDAEQRDLEAIMSHRHLDRGQSLLVDGDRADFAYNVISGGIKLFKSLSDGRTQITGFLLAGDFLGLPVRGTYVYSAEALADTVLCQFPRDPLQAAFEKHPRLQARLLTAVTDDFSSAQEHMLLLGRKTAVERLCSFLRNLLERAERVGGTVDPLTIPLLRNEIADYLGLTIETVSRAFTLLRQVGLISMNRADEIIIMDRMALEVTANGG